jgi:hypothetical protein
MTTIIQQLKDEQAARRVQIRRVEAAIAALVGGAVTPPRPRGRRTMSAAERQAVSERMKKSWAKRKRQMGASKK